MTPAVLALLALVLTLVLSATTRLNVGLIAIALAWLVGVYGAGLKADAVVGGFPASLFVTLAGVTLLFAMTKSNGTLDLLAARAMRSVRGNAALLPLLFFAIAGVISSVGPGAIASVALVAPVAMVMGARAGVPPLLSAISIGCGANAGNLSPLSAIGAMANTLISRAGITGHEGKVWAAGALAHLAVAAAAYVLFGGLRLVRAGGHAVATEDASSLDRRHWITVAVVAAWMIAVVVWRTNVGLAAFASATILVLARAVDEGDAIRRVPLDVILMVVGVSMLIAVLETTGGMDLFTGLLGRAATPATVYGMIALVTGVISIYSSTSGVVLPAFLPMVPGLVREVGGGDPLGVALSITVGSALVDVSPLSTLGALCVAAVDRDQAKPLFRQLLLWGFAMAVVGAVLCALFARPFARV